VYLSELGESLRKDLDRHESSENPKDRLKCCIGGVLTDVLKGILDNGKRSEAEISNLVLNVSRPPGRSRLSPGLERRPA
jgi:hypothetical protein